MVANLNFAIKAVNEAHAALSDVSTQLDEVGGKAGSTGGILGDMGGKLALIGTMAAAAGVGLGSMIADKSISAASDLGAEVNKLSIATGLSDTAASEWIGTGAHFGLQADYMTASMDKASKAIFGGIDPTTGLMVAGGKLDDTLTHYGITTKDVSGNALDMNTIMMSTADVFSKMPDGPEKTALALKLFGKAGVDMIPMLDQGSAGVQTLMGSVDAMGLTLDSSGVQKTKDFAFAQRDMNEAVKGAEVQIGLALMPTLTKLITFMATTGIPTIKTLATEGVAFVKQKFDEWQPTLAAIWDIITNKVVPIVKDLTVLYLKALRSEFVDFLIPAMVTLYGGFMNLLPAFKAVADFVSQNVIPVFVTIGGFLRDHPALLAALAVAILLIVAPWVVVVAGIVIVLAKWDEIKTMFTVTIPNAIDSVITKITGIAVIGPMFQGMIDAVKLVVTTGFETLKGIFQTQIDLVEGIVKLVLDLIHGDFGKFWTDLTTLIGKMFDDIKGLFSIQLDLVKGLISDALTMWEGVITGAASLFLAAGTAILTGLYNGASDVITNTILPFFTGLIGQVIGALGDVLSALYNAGTDLLTGLYNGVTGFATGSLLPFFADLPAQSLKALELERDLTLYLMQAGTDLLTGLYNAAVAGGVTVLTFFINLPGRIVGEIGDLGSTLYDAGVKIIAGLLSGITSKFNDVKHFVGGIAGTISGLKGPPAVDAVLLVEHGKLIMQGLLDGLKAKENDLKTQLQQVTLAIATNLDPTKTAYLESVKAGLQQKMAELMATVSTTISHAAPAVTAAATVIGSAWLKGIDTEIVTKAPDALGHTAQVAVDSLVSGLDSGQLNVTTASARLAKILPQFIGDPALYEQVKGDGSAIIKAYADSMTAATPVVVSAITVVAQQTIGGYVISTHGAWQAAKDGHQDIASLITDNVLGIAPSIAAIFPKLSSSAQQAIQIITDGLTSGQLTVAAASKLLAQILPQYLSDPVMYERVKQAGSDIIAAYNSGMASVPVNPIPAPTVGAPTNPGGTPTSTGTPAPAPFMRNVTALTLASGLPGAPTVGAEFMQNVQSAVNLTWFETMGGNYAWAVYTAKALGEDINKLNFTPMPDVITALNKFGKLSAFQAAGGVAYPDMMAALRSNGLSYDQGGWLQPGVTLAVNNTGRPERVGGGEIIVNVYYSAPNALVVDGAAVTQAVKTVLPEIKRQLTMQGSWGMA